jgi:hypothetical protein
MNFYTLLRIEKKNCPKIIVYEDMLKKNDWHIFKSHVFLYNQNYEELKDNIGGKYN